MMKRLNTVPAAILAVLLIGCLVAAFMTRNAGTRPAATAKTVAGDQAVARDMALFDTADRLAALAETSDEKNQAQEAQRLADHELDQAFATALRQAVAYRVPAGPLRDLAARIDQLKTRSRTRRNASLSWTRRPPTAPPIRWTFSTQREFCRAWPNQREVTVKGAHFLPEDSPHEVAEATASFVAKVLAGQIS